VTIAASAAAWARPACSNCSGRSRAQPRRGACRERRRTIAFPAHDWLRVERFRNGRASRLRGRLRRGARNLSIRRIAREKCAPYNRLADTESPWFERHKVLSLAQPCARPGRLRIGMLARPSTTRLAHAAALRLRDGVDLLLHMPPSWSSSVCLHAHPAATQSADGPTARHFCKQTVFSKN